MNKTQKEREEINNIIDLFMFALKIKVPSMTREKTENVIINIGNTLQLERIDNKNDK